ncbi:MAG: trehalase [Deltaproteobacteria bacterium]|nr:trehalase [Deltaproteobacteria bacterium]
MSFLALGPESRILRSPEKDFASGDFYSAALDPNAYQNIDYIVPDGEALKRSLFDSNAAAGAHKILEGYHKLRGDLSAQLSYLIREVYWDRLVRRIDEHGLQEIFTDSKAEGSNRIVYVPHDDALALRYFSEVAERRKDLNFTVEVLPKNITPEFVRSLNERAGILSLGVQQAQDGSLEARAFVVPGGRFNEMYGWDSYFTALGLIEDGRTELVKSMTDNFIYQIEHYGKVLNANRSYYLTRSQPPVFVPMAEAALEAMDRGGLWQSDQQRKEWITAVCRAAIKEYREVWTAPDHITPETSLSHYWCRGIGFCPEVEKGHYEVIVKWHALKVGMSIEDYIEAFNNGTIENKELEQFIKHDRAMRESGHDTSYRMLGKAASLNTVELNSLLFRAETELARLLSNELNGSLELEDGSIITAGELSRRAGVRKIQFDRFLWDDRDGMFFDWDPEESRRTGYVTASSFFALACGVASQEQADRFIPAALSKLECIGGITASDEASRGPITKDRPLRQWDYPFSWAPHIMTACEGLARYGHEKDAERLAYKWLYMLTKEAVIHKGAIVERYDGANSTVFEGAEYGAQGLQGPIDRGAGFAWSNASFQCLKRYLSEEKLQALSNMIAPQELFAKN